MFSLYIQKGKIMNNKCSKYESLFTFSDRETLDAHLSECEECRKEEEKMQKVSSLLDEVKLYYYAKRKQKRAKLRALCAVLVFSLFTSLSLGLLVTNEDLADTIMYGQALTAEDYGFPVDSYGLLMVDE